MHLKEMGIEEQFFSVFITGKIHTKSHFLNNFTVLCKRKGLFDFPYASNSTTFPLCAFGGLCLAAAPGCLAVEVFHNDSIFHSTAQ